MSEQDRKYDKYGGSGKGNKDPMSPEKIREHAPTAVRRDPSDQKIVEQGETAKNPEEARKIARAKGMAEGTAGAAATGSEYEQGSAGTNK